ncbi:MAG: Rieske (2Fe-2S) protein [Candidatus Kapabacteria bacterium]|nr:Rieske (2Fe-2S) protein [Candidatus Kapabacteria bacterium]
MESTKLGRTSRRTWFVAIGSAVGALPLLYALQKYISPLSIDHARTETIGALDEVIADGSRRELHVAGMNVLLARRGLDVVAIDLTCTHAACPLHVDESAGRIRCGCHGGVFDLEGRVVQAPPTEPLRRIEARVTNGVLYLRIPSGGTA